MTDPLDPSATAPTVATGPVAPSTPDVTLFGDGGLDWRPVSPKLATARFVVLGCVAVLPLLGALALAIFVSAWLWLAVAFVVVVVGWVAWVIGRQVPMISWAETAEELVIRKGRLFRTVVSVPYGRLQFVDVQSGPLARKFGMATVELHTASPESGGQIPGLPTEVAEQLRERLAARGESQRAGL
ncbi:PH domain-containing protein [Knoellia koreensis]|uniref:PH domain-containing protein n=1 Tax=Knoellia koreensis TaxID=2730921 RepID=UPI003211F89C